MSFEVDRYSSSWARVALCADITWVSEPPDDFVIANQRLWANHCRVTQVLQESTSDSHSSQRSNQCDVTDNRPSLSHAQDIGNSSGAAGGRRSVKDVIPESRLAQFYGNFYYDEAREKCYTNSNEKPNARGYNESECGSSDLTECWMLPEVDYWYRRLVDDQDRNTISRRRREYRMLAEDDFLCWYVKYGRVSAASERWGPSTPRAGDEAALAARVLSVRPLWASNNPPRRAPSPPPAPRKMRARRRQPRRLAVLAPPRAYCIEAPAQLLCDPSCKFQFDSPRPPQLTDCQKRLERLANVQAVMKANAVRCPPYRGTNITRYAPSQRPVRYPERRYGVWWPRDHPSARLERFQLPHVQSAPPTKPVNHSNQPTITNLKTTEEKKDDKAEENVNEEEHKKEDETPPHSSTQDHNPTPPHSSTQDHNPDYQITQEKEAPESPRKETQHKENFITDGEVPSTSATIKEGLRKKRLYSTVLSMSPPSPINITGCVRLSQKITPGLIKLNPKLVLTTTRIRPPNTDVKYEELEKEALEQYKASDESIDTKFRELEKQAEEQYSTSNSNTSCDSGNPAEKQNNSNPSVPENEEPKKQNQQAKFHKEKAVDSVVIYSQNFPELNTKANEKNLKNCHIPPRGDKKEHRSKKSLKIEMQRAASDTDYEAHEANSKAAHKGPLRWTLHAVPPKKRHLSSCVSDFSSDDDIKDEGSIKDAKPCKKSHVTGKIKMSAHGGGDLRPIMRKT